MYFCFWSDSVVLWQKPTSLGTKKMTESYNSDFSILSIFGAHNTSNLVFRLLHAADFWWFFLKWMVVFSRNTFLFVLERKSSPVRSFPWSGKYHPSSELGKRSKTVLKTAIPTFLHGFLFLAQWTWTLCQLWLFETSFGPFSELRCPMKLSGPAKWPHERALSS